MAALCAFGSAASAAPGDHIRAGELVIMPDLDLGFVYRSNAFRSQTNPQGVGALRVAPGVRMTLDNAEYTFAMDGEYVIETTLFLGNPESLGQGTIRDQRNSLNRFNSFNIGAELAGLKTRTVGFSLTERVQLQNNPNDSVPETDDPYSTQIRNNVGLRMNIRPGPALSVGIGGHWQWAQFFVPSAFPDRVALNTRNSVGPDLQVKWTFLPRTAYIFESQYRWNIWADQNPTIGDLSFATPNSHGFQARTGIQGRVTERIRALATVGFGSLFFADGTAVKAGDGLLVTLQGDYDVTERQRVTLGYRKSFFDSFFTNSAASNTVYGRWTGQFGTRVDSNLEYAVRFENYDGGVERNDTVQQLNARVNVRVVDWLGTNVNGGWLQRRSTDEVVEYDDVRIGAGITLVY